MSNSEHPTEPIGLPPSFRGAARRALGRRNRAFFLAQNRRPLELAFTVTVSVLGLMVFGWSAASIWVFLVLNLWSVFFCNWFKYLTAKDAVNRYYQHVGEDARLWAAVNAVRNNKDPFSLPPPAKKSWSPKSLLILDVFGLSIVTAEIFGIAWQAGINLLAEFSENPALMWLSGVSLALQILPPLWTDRFQDPSTGKDIMKFDGGGGIIIGWVLMFLFAATFHLDDDLSISVLAYNAILALGIPVSVFASFAYKQETSWLKQQIGEESGSDH